MPPPALTDRRRPDAGPPAPSHRPALYYACSLPLSAGGELVNFQHAAALRRLGWRAFALLDPGARVALPSQPYPVPLVTWSETLRWHADDWLVVPEVTPPARFERLAALPCRVVIHNQNPYYTFRGFADMERLNAFPLAGGLCPSGFTRETLRRWGSRCDWQVVRPPLLPHFAQAAATAVKRQQIAYMPRKRPEDAAALRALFRGLFPEFAAVPWVEISHMDRPAVARALAESSVFASLSRSEGLGLPPLEAMAAGCVVCGFDGQGGREYATPDNGLWVAEGELEGFARALAAALRLDAAETARRVAAGRATAAAFSPERFEAELQAAWLRLLGVRAPDYRVAPAQEIAHVD
jgi:hypothetical protein